MSIFSGRPAWRRIRKGSGFAVLQSLFGWGMALLPAFSIARSPRGTPLRVMSFNIRYDNPSDSPNHWQARREKVLSQVLFYDTDLLGIQEALHTQVLDIQAGLPDFGFVGVGRNDGQTSGEYAGIFFRKTRLELLQSGHFWLSTTPEVTGSIGWDAAITRMVTYARFKDRESGKSFYHFNTHFDHMGREARRHSALLLLDKVFLLSGNDQAIVTGDFNAVPEDEPMLILLDSTRERHFIHTATLSRSGHYGPTGTFNGFGPRERDDQPIDYILLKRKAGVLKHATLSESWQGRFASDHFAVMAVLNPE